MKTKDLRELAKVIIKDLINGVNLDITIDTRFNSLIYRYDISEDDYVLFLGGGKISINVKEEDVRTSMGFIISELVEEIIKENYDVFS